MGRTPRIVENLNFFSDKGQVYLRFTLPLTYLNNALYHDCEGFILFQIRKKIGQEITLKDHFKQNRRIEFKNMGQGKRVKIENREVIYALYQLTPGYYYEFYLKTFNAKGVESTPSNRIRIYWVHPPLPPFHLRSIAKVGLIQIDFVRPLYSAHFTAIDGFNVYRRKADQDYPQTPHNKTLVKSDSFIDNDVQEDVTYFYSVRTVALFYSTAIEGPPSNEISAIISDTTPPLMPKGLISQIEKQCVTLTWNANLDKKIAGYRVYRRPYHAMDWTLLNRQSLIKRLTFSDCGVPAGKHYYAVSAVDQSKNRNESSKGLPLLVRVP